MDAALADPYAADRALARRCVEGDPAAHRELFQSMSRRVHATLYRLFGTNHQIDDLIQDAFLQVFRSLDRYRGEASLATWVDRCVVRVAYAEFRGRRRRAGFLEVVPELASDEPSAEARLAARDAVRRLYAILDRLDADHRVAFVLHAIDGRPMDEVARLTEASLPATKSRVLRARREIEARARRDRELLDFLPDDEGEAR